MHTVLCLLCSSACIQQFHAYSTKCQRVSAAVARYTCCSETLHTTNCNSTVCDLNITQYRVCVRHYYLHMPPSAISSACVPISATPLLAITAIRSLFWIVLSLCAILIAVRFFSWCSLSNADCTTFSLSLSNADVASSVLYMQTANSRRVW
jgi:hypothetical protein